MLFEEINEKLNWDYSRPSITRTSIIRISQLSGLFLWSQFGYDYLLVTIKIRCHILFKTTALKSAVKRKGFLLSKSKAQRAKAALALVVSNDLMMSSDWLRVGLLLKPGFHIVVSVVSVVRKKFIGQIEFILSRTKRCICHFYCIEQLCGRFP